MTKGIVYILTNPCLDGWIKIGMTTKNDMKSRLDQLNTPTNIPLSFRVYAEYHVSNPKQVEKDIHKLIDMVDDSLHARETLASGRVREREFFQISPEKAYVIMSIIAKNRNDLGSLKLIQATEEEQQEEAVIKRRPAFSFKMLGIPTGSELVFIRDESIICTVVDDNNQVDYQGEKTSLSALATKLLDWNSDYSVQGPLYFTYEGESISDRRYRLEQSDTK